MSEHETSPDPEGTETIPAPVEGRPSDGPTASGAPAGDTDSGSDDAAQRESSAATSGEATHRDGAEPTLERLLNLQVPVIVVLAETKMALSDVLELKRDGIISFGKSNDEPLDLYVNDCRVGRGKAVKQRGQLGLWIDEIGSPEELVRQLG